MVYSAPSVSIDHIHNPNDLSAGGTIVQCARSPLGRSKQDGELKTYNRYVKMIKVRIHQEKCKPS